MSREKDETGSQGGRRRADAGHPRERGNRNDRRDLSKLYGGAASRRRSMVSRPDGGDDDDGDDRRSSSSHGPTLRRNPETGEQEVHARAIVSGVDLDLVRDADGFELSTKTATEAQVEGLMALSLEYGEIAFIDRMAGFPPAWFADFWGVSRPTARARLSERGRMSPDRWLSLEALRRMDHGELAGPLGYQRSNKTIEAVLTTIYWDVLGTDFKSRYGDRRTTQLRAAFIQAFRIWRRKSCNERIF